LRAFVIRKQGHRPVHGCGAAYWRELIALDVARLVRDAKVRSSSSRETRISRSQGRDFELLRRKVGDTKGRVTFKSFAGLNHLFMKVEHGSTGAEYGFPGHVDPAVIGAIADWITAH